MLLSAIQMYVFHTYSLLIVNSDGCVSIYLVTKGEGWFNVSEICLRFCSVGAVVKQPSVRCG